MRALVERAGAWFRARFDGDASVWPLPLFRVGLGAIVLARTTDWLAPIVALDHHQWVRGVEFAPSDQAVQPPALWSPLFAFMPQLPDVVIEACAQARPWLALALIAGIYPRTAAGLLALLGYGLMALDRYRYFHHMHLLWLTCALLALCPSQQRLSVHAFRAREPARRAPRWPLQLLRFSVLVVYAAAGLAKLDPNWLSGRALERWQALTLVGGPLYTNAVHVLGTPGLAALAAVIELALIPLLCWPRTRVLGIALGLSLHYAFAVSMTLSTFSAQMALYLLLFWPRWTGDAFGVASRP